MKFNPYTESNIDIPSTLFNLLGQVALKDWEENRKEKRYKERIKALKTGGLMGQDIYPKSISGEGELSYGIRTPEEKIDLANKMSQFQRQQDIGKYMGAKATLEAPSVSTMERPRLLAMPKEQAKQIIENRFMLRPQARQVISKTPKELQGRNFLLTAQGKYRETAPKLPKDIRKDVFTVAAKLAGDPLMYDDQTAYRQAIIDNIPQAQEILKVSGGKVATNPSRKKSINYYKQKYGF